MRKPLTVAEIKSLQKYVDSKYGIEPAAVSLGVHSWTIRRTLNRSTNPNNPFRRKLTEAKII